MELSTTDMAERRKAFLDESELRSTNVRSEEQKTAPPVAGEDPGSHLVTDVIEHLATTFAEERGRLEERWSRSNIVVGVIGVLIGAFIMGAFITDRVLAPLGIAAGSPVALIIVAFIGAVILVTLLRLFAGSGVGGRRWDRRKSHAHGVDGRRFFGRRYVGPRG